MLFKISQKELIDAVSKTMKVIAKSPAAVVRFNYFMQSLDLTIVHCLATLQESKTGRALELLNASVRDKTFGRNISRIIGVPLNVSVGYWSNYTYLASEKYSLTRNSASRDSSLIST